MWFMALVKKELRSIRREKTIMFAIFIQLFIAAFSSFLLIGVMSFYNPESIGDNDRIHIDLGIVGDFDNPIVYRVDDASHIKVTRFDEIGQSESAFKNGRVDVVMVIPPVNPGSVIDMTLILPKSDTESMLITMALDGPLKEAENDLRKTNGIDLKYDDLEGKSHMNFEFLYSIIIPVLMFFPALIAGNITIDTISEELQNKTLDTLWAAPLPLWGIFSSKIFTAGVTAMLQCILWVTLLELNSLSVQNIPQVLLLATLIAFCVSFGAGIIALILRDRERAQFVFSIGLVTLAGLSYLVEPSPFELMTWLSSDNHFAGLDKVVSYMVPLVFLAGMFYFASRRLAVSRT